MKCKKTAFCCWKDWVNITASIYSNKISVAVSSVQQCYSECASHHCYVNILLMSLSWDAYVSYA